jgi:phospholipid/cholesterol/gamma-HCH transport system substrate-binding protein
MKNNQREFYIGLSVISTIVMVIVVIFFLEKSNFLQSGITINLTVQNANGIESGEQVLYRGLEVGAVQDTKIIKNGILLKLKITRLDSLPSDSRFVIANSSLIGGKVVEIIPGKSDHYIKDGAFIKGESGAGFSDIIQNVDNVADNIRKVVNNVDTLTNKETRTRIRGALNEIDKSVRLIHTSLKNNLDDIHTTIKNMKEITVQNKAPIDSIIINLARNSERMNNAVINLEKTTKDLKEIVAGINMGKGTAGKLLTDDSLYNKINSTLTDLNSLIKDIKENPDRYIHISVF